MAKPRKRTKSDHNSDPIHKKNTDPIPMDIVKEILQRLPVKSIAKFITVSKSWSTIIRSNYFISSFSLQQSMATQHEPHCLLIGLNENNNFTFFSLSSVNEKPSSKFISRMVYQFDQPDEPIYLKGLLSFTCRRTQVICNPSTGKFIVLPPVKTRRKILVRYFGFDPIKAEYKVLCIIDSMCSRDGRITPSQNQVLTLGSNNLWRKLDFWIRHRPVSLGICIDGIIYYLAKEFLDLSRIFLVRFDVKSEKFLKQLPCLFLQFLEPMRLWYPLKLINYNSKLAIVYQPSFHYLIDLWVLEDVEKLEWSKISHDISPWTSFLTGYVKTMGITPNDEIVYRSCTSDGYYLIYHDHKKNQNRRIEIKSNMRIAFIDYVESVMFL